MILGIVAWATNSDTFDEVRCEREGGRVMVATALDRKLCDFAPYADNILDMSGNDYWIE